MKRSLECSLLGTLPKRLGHQERGPHSPTLVNMGLSHELFWVGAERELEKAKLRTFHTTELCPEENFLGSS